VIYLCRQCLSELIGKKLELYAYALETTGNLLILRSHYAMIVWRGTYEGQSYAPRRFRNPFYNAVRRLARVKRSRTRKMGFTLLQVVRSLEIALRFSRILHNR